MAVQPRFVTEFGGIGPVVVDSSYGRNMCEIEDKWQISVATPCATVALAIDLHVTRPVGAANDQFCSALGRELTADSAADIDALLGLSLGLDVWERHSDSLVVAASEAQLLELERRRLVRVERLATQAEFEARARGGPHSAGPGGV